MSDNNKINEDIRKNLKAKIEAKRLSRLNKKVKEDKLNNLKNQADKELKEKFGEDYNIENFMSSFMQKMK